MTKILVLFYSMYGHIYKMAEAVAEGVREVEDVQCVIKQVPETIGPEVLEESEAVKSKEEFSHIPVADPLELGNYDAIIFGTPTRFGNMTGQMRQFLDQTGGLWSKGKLVGKVGSVFTAASNQHGGLETTILTFSTNLFHQGMVIVGLPYTFQEQMGVDEIKGGSPYGASTISGMGGDRMPSEIELAGARFQGKHVAQITKKLAS